MFIIKNLSVSVQTLPIIHSVDLSLVPGSLHVIVGPNGSGKSTLVKTLIGHPDCHVQSGSIMLNGIDITHESIEKRARLGIFVAFQHTLSMPGIKINTFLHASHQALSQEKIDDLVFTQRLKEVFGLVGLPDHFTQRYLHDGFSGGERKRLELAQLLLLPCKVALLDEIDSGLDARGIQAIIELLQKIREQKPELIVVVVTHNNQLLQDLSPHYVHHMSAQTLVKDRSYEQS